MPSDLVRTARQVIQGLNLSELDKLLQFARKPISRGALAQARDAVTSGVEPAYAAASSKGLPLDYGSRRARALEQGFTTPAYHGTSRYDDDLANHARSTADLLYPEQDDLLRGLSNSNRAVLGARPEPAADLEELISGSRDYRNFRPGYRYKISTALGPHFAPDPTISNVFARDLDDPSRVMPVLLRGGQYDVPQPWHISRNRIIGDDDPITGFPKESPKQSGSWYSPGPMHDDTAVALDAMHRYYENNPGMLKELMESPHGGLIGSDVSGDLSVRLAAGETVEPRQMAVGTHPTNLYQYLQNRGALMQHPHMGPIIRNYSKQLGEEGTPIIHYENTAPGEIEGARDRSSLIQTDPTGIRNVHAVFDPDLADEPGLHYAEGGPVDWYDDPAEVAHYQHPQAPPPDSTLARAMKSFSSAVASNVMGYDPQTHDLSFGKTPGAWWGLASLPSLVHDFGPDSYISHAADMDDAINSTSRRNVGLPERPSDTTDTVASMAGNMVGSLPFPVSKISGALNLARRSASPVVRNAGRVGRVAHTIAPVVDPKLSNYAWGTAIGSGINDIASSISDPDYHSGASTGWAGGGPVRMATGGTPPSISSTGGPLTYTNTPIDYFNYGTGPEQLFLQNSPADLNTVVNPGGPPPPVFNPVGDTGPSSDTGALSQVALSAQGGGGGSDNTHGVDNAGQPGSAAELGSMGSTLGNRAVGLAGSLLGLGTPAGVVGLIGTLAQHGYLGTTMQGNQNMDINANPAAFKDFASEPPGWLDSAVQHDVASMLAHQMSDINSPAGQSGATASNTDPAAGFSNAADNPSSQHAAEAQAAGGADSSGGHSAGADSTSGEGRGTGTGSGTGEGGSERGNGYAGGGSIDHLIHHPLRMGATIPLGRAA